MFNNLFSRKPKEFFSPDERKKIVDAIRASEKRTSGEIRVFVESRCSYVEPLDRAVEIFYGLKMEETEDRNAVLLYLAMKDRQLAVYADKGIHEKMGTGFWQTEVNKMISLFNTTQYGDGIAGIVSEIGIALHYHFPYEDDDKNELPDDIVFGR